MSNQSSDKNNNSTISFSSTGDNLPPVENKVRKRFEHYLSDPLIPDSTRKGIWAAVEELYQKLGIKGYDLADTMVEEFRKQQANKTEQEQAINLLEYILECTYSSIYEDSIKKKTLGLLQRAQIPVVTSTGKQDTTALGNIPQLRKWFIGKGLSAAGITCAQIQKEDTSNSDRVNHPSHYTWLKDLCGIEVIDITRHMDFDLGNATKYVLRQGQKSEQGMSNREKAIEDLEKAIWYIKDKIEMLKKGGST